MREFVGDIFVQLKSPKRTGEIMNMPLYDYLFVRIKNVYIPFFNMFNYGVFATHDDGVMKSYYFANIFSNNYREYVKGGLWDDVERVKVKSPDNPVTAVVLKALNIIEKSNINMKYIKLFDMRLGTAPENFLSNDREKKVFGYDYARDIIHGMIASYLSGKSTILVGDNPTPLFTPLEFDAMKNIDFNRINADGNLVVNVNTDVKTPSPVFTYTRYFIPFGRLQMRVLFNKDFYWYNPPFSSRTITGMFNTVPDYDYNFNFIPVEKVCGLKGLSKISVPRKIPVLKKPESNEIVYSTVLNNKLFTIIKYNGQYSVVELDLNNIVSRGAKSLAYKCPTSVKPITNISKDLLNSLLKIGV